MEEKHSRPKKIETEDQNGLVNEIFKEILENQHGWNIESSRRWEIGIVGRSYTHGNVINIIHFDILLDLLEEMMVYRNKLLFL